MSSYTGNRTADRKSNYKSDNFDKNKDYSNFGHGVEVKFYKPKDWNKLSVGQRNYVRQGKLQQKAEAPAAAQTTTQTTAQMVSTVASLQASIQELTSRLNGNGNGNRKRRRDADDTSTTESESSSDSPSRRKVKFHTQRRG